MNKERRNEIQKCIDELEDIKSRLESVRDSEDEAFSNLPDSLQYSEKGDIMQENVDQLDDATGQIDDVLDILQEIIEK
jgi:division protein CdvB (Snf7/Vps24/ESCRT-III family)